MIEVMGRGFWRWMENETGAGRRLSKGRERSACSLMDIGIGAIMNNGARMRRETRVALSKEIGQRTGEEMDKEIDHFETTQDKVTVWTRPCSFWELQFVLVVVN